MSCPKYPAERSQFSRDGDVMRKSLVAASLLLVTSACGGEADESDESGFLLAVEENSALATAMDLVPNNSELLRVGYAVCEQLELYDASLAVDASKAMYPDDAKTVELVHDEAHEFLCPDADGASE